MQSIILHFIDMLLHSLHFIQASLFLKKHVNYTNLHKFLKHL